MSLRRNTMFSQILLAYFFVLVMGGAVELWGQLPKFGLPGSSAKAVSADAAVQLKVVGQYNKVVPGQRFALAVVFEIGQGWHLYANPRRGELGKDTEIIAEAVDGLRWGSVIYDQGDYYEDKLLEASNYIYEGRVVCYLPVEVSEDGFAASTAVKAIEAFRALTVTRA